MTKKTAQKIKAYEIYEWLNDQLHIEEEEEQEQEQEEQEQAL